MVGRNKSRLDLEFGVDELILERGDLILKLTGFIDRYPPTEESLSFPVEIDLSSHLQEFLGINEDFKPYDRIEVTNSLHSLEKLKLLAEDLISQQKLELKRMDEDPHYFEEYDEDDDDDEYDDEYEEEEER